MKYIFFVLVEDEVGVLICIVSLFVCCGFNIESLVVGLVE